MKVRGEHKQLMMNTYTARYIPTKGVDRRLRNKTMEPEHFLVAETQKVNQGHC